MGILVYNGQSIEQRDTDGMVCLTQMAKANGVSVNDWAKTDQAGGYIQELMRTTNKIVDDIFVSKPGSPENGGGSWGHYLLVIEFGRWISAGFAIWCDQHIHRLVTTGKTELEVDRQNLEIAAATKPKPSEIWQVTKMYKTLYGDAYAQQYFDQKMQRFAPALAGQKPDTSQVASLPSTKHRLIPREIARELGLFHGTGNPDGGAANKLMESLGYQAKVGKIWIPTDKAIDAGYVDRKPVDTSSRSQKDQLLWSADILPILQEHSEAIA
jgi:hypothetical protein